MKHALNTLLFLILTWSICSFQCAAEEFISNGDFEADAEEYVVWPGYVGGVGDAGENPIEITDWFGTGGRGINPIDAAENPNQIAAWPGEGGRGINPIANGDAPFRDNGDNDTVAAFIQNTGLIQQDVSGLEVGANYLLSFEFNSRNCCGDQPMAGLLLNGNAVADFPDPGEFDDGLVPPVLDFEPWYQASIPFVADSENLNISITSEAFEVDNPDSLDATLLIDNVSLVKLGTADELIVNGDFESEADLFDVWPGYVGGGQNNAPFRDNGDNKTAVAFLQGTASLEQEVTGLTPGEEYTISLDFNARNCCAGEVPIAELLIDNDFVDDFPGDDLEDGIVRPVGGSEPWYHFETTFVAEEASHVLLINTFPAGEGGGDSTLVIDNVSWRTKNGGHSW